MEPSKFNPATNLVLVQERGGEIRKRGSGETVRTAPIARRKSIDLDGSLLRDRAPIFAFADTDDAAGMT